MSATETKKATVATSETIAELFHEAMRSYEKALKSGILMQEESVNLWKELLTKLGSPEELQPKLDSMTADAFPKARKRMEEFVETFNRTSKQTIDLFEKTLGVYQATSVPDAQRRVQDLIENSLSTLRVNVHSALNTNAKIIAAESPAIELQNLRDAFDDHVRQLAEKDAEIQRLKAEREVMRKFSVNACSARDKMYAENDQLRYLITELTNAAKTREGVPFWLIERAGELSKKLRN